MADAGFAMDQIHDGDLLIAADGGLRHAMRLGLTPDIIVGDLDSAPNELLQLAERRGTQIIRHPVRKDSTDLELALDICRERRIDEILIIGGLGGRLDHALANIMLLAGTHTAPESLRMVEGDLELMVVRDHVHITGSPGDTVTLLALTDGASGITTEGLEYPLADESLGRGSSRGVSNVMLSGHASVAVNSGALLLIHLAIPPPAERVELD